MEQEYYIYRVTCVSTNKSYIGQTQKYKYKNSKPYQYGIIGRWCDHVSSAKRSNTPLHQAIRECGLDNFTTQLLETVSESNADVCEAYWIGELNTIVPNGYNVMSHSRCKHRESTDIANIYPDATGVEIKHIRKNGVPCLVYMYINTPTERKRITFGQSKNDTFETALQKAEGVINQYRERGVKVINSDKSSEFIGQQLKRIRVVPFNKTMVAIYITDQQDKQTRICFGGKHISFEDASKQAEQFINRLSANRVENLLKSRQQVAPCLDEVNSK